MSQHGNSPRFDILEAVPFLERLGMDNDELRSFISIGMAVTDRDTYEYRQAMSFKRGELVSQQMTSAIARLRSSIRGTLIEPRG